MKSIIKNIIGILLLGVVSWAGITMMSWPDLEKIKQQVNKRFLISEISYRNNYQELVSEERQNGNSFLKNEVIYAKIHDNRFPFFSKKLETSHLQNILEILNDTGSYRWGEFGTPEYDKTVIYYGNTNAPIGYTLIDPMGEVENYPYRALMKWGMLTNKEFDHLLSEME